MGKAEHDYVSLLNKVLDFPPANGFSCASSRAFSRSELFRFHRRFHRPLTLDSFAKIQQPRRTGSESNIPMNSSDYSRVQKTSLVLLLSITGAYADYGRLWSVKRRRSSMQILHSKEYSTANRRRTKLFAIGSRNILNFWHARLEKRDDEFWKERKTKQTCINRVHKIAICIITYNLCMQYSCAHTHVQRNADARP